MATLLQLQSEPYWDREIVTPEIDWLGDELCRRTNRPRTAFGAKGDRYHLRGAHRSQEWLTKSSFSTSRTYTVQSGLLGEQLRHVAGIDFTPSSLTEMIAQSKRILAAMKAGKLDEVREFYGNVNGDKIVDGWDNVNNESETADSSHLWHWHLTLDRHHCTNRGLMERILNIVLGLDEGDGELDAKQSEQLATVSWSVGRGVKSLNPADQGKMVAFTWWGGQVGALLQEIAARVDLSEAEIQAIVDKVPDTTNEQEIITGILSGLGQKPVTEIYSILKPLLGDQRAQELGRLLTGETSAPSGS